MFSILRRKAEEYDEQIRDYLADGSISSIEQYNRVIGRLEGVAMMNNEIREIEKRFIQD